MLARRVRPAAAMALAGILLLTACTSIPADAAGTSDRVRGGELRAGVTHNPPWTDTSTAEPTGSEVALVESLARGLDARVEWVEGSEAVLADALHEGELDIAVGGFTDDTPWTEQAAVTAVYREVRNDRGVTEKHVMLTRSGENRFLVTIEDHLRENGADR
ncbi:MULTISPECIES: transporter substrate-binding domain-containing protein [Microbacterium]|nr:MULTISPECIES: transporter substrate-binding domain-containing protein [Microbacterium]